MRGTCYICKTVLTLNILSQLNFVPDTCKPVVMIPKHDKSLTKLKSYLPISLLPIVLKLLEKLI